MPLKIVLFVVVLAAVVVIGSSTRPSPALLPPAAVYPPPSVAETKLLQRLPLVRMRGVPLDQAIDQLRNQTGANIVVHWGPPGADGTRRIPLVDVELRDATLAQVLHHALEGVKGQRAFFTFGPADDVIVVADVEGSGDPGSAWKIYDAHDLIAGEVARRRANRQLLRGTRSSQVATATKPVSSADDQEEWGECIDQLTRLVVDTIVPESWRENGGNVGQLHELNGRFVIVQTWENHQRVAEFLEALRTTGIPSAPPATQSAASGEGAKP